MTTIAWDGRTLVTDTRMTSIPYVNPDDETYKDDIVKIYRPNNGWLRVNESRVTWMAFAGAVSDAVKMRLWLESHLHDFATVIKSIGYQILMPETYTALLTANNNCYIFYFKQIGESDTQLREQECHLLRLNGFSAVGSGAALGHLITGMKAEQIEFTSADMVYLASKGDTRTSGLYSLVTALQRKEPTIRKLPLKRRKFLDEIFVKYPKPEQEVVNV